MTRLADPLPVSEDFGLVGSGMEGFVRVMVRCGTEPDLYQRAIQAGRVSQDVPTTDSLKAAPVVHRTLETGIQTLATADLS